MKFHCLKTQFWRFNLPWEEEIYIAFFIGGYQQLKKNRNCILWVSKDEEKEIFFSSTIQMITFISQWNSLSDLFPFKSLVLNQWCELLSSMCDLIKLWLLLFIVWILKDFQKYLCITWVERFHSLESFCAFDSLKKNNKPKAYNKEKKFLA